MVKHRVKRKSKKQKPRGNTGDWLRAGLQMKQLFTSSMQVIEHRNDMLIKAMKGEIPLDSQEFMEMWQEKFIAGGESMRIAMMLMGRSNPYATSLNDWMHVLTPYRQKAYANAKRLRKKKKP